jgi:hypothetical protein
MSRVADRVEILENKVQRLDSELKEARRQRDIAIQDKALMGPDPYNSLSGRVADLMRSLEEKIEKLNREAEAEAKRVAAEAEQIRVDAESAAGEMRAAAERTLQDARTEAEQVRVDAKSAAGEMRAAAELALSNLTSRREEIRSQLLELGDGLLEAARRLQTSVGEESFEDQVFPAEDAGNGVAADTHFDRLAGGAA